MNEFARRLLSSAIISTYRPELGQRGGGGSEQRPRAMAGLGRPRAARRLRVPQARAHAGVAGPGQAVSPRRAAPGAACSGRGASGQSLRARVGLLRPRAARRLPGSARASARRSARGVWRGPARITSPRWQGLGTACSGRTRAALHLHLCGVRAFVAHALAAAFQALVRVPSRTSCCPHWYSLTPLRYGSGLAVCFGGVSSAYQPLSQRQDHN